MPRNETAPSSSHNGAVFLQRLYRFLLCQLCHQRHAQAKAFQEGTPLIFYTEVADCVDIPTVKTVGAVRKLYINGEYSIFPKEDAPEKTEYTEQLSLFDFL